MIGMISCATPNSRLRGTRKFHLAFHGCSIILATFAGDVKEIANYLFARRKPLCARRGRGGGRSGSYSNALPEGMGESYSNAPSRCSGASICSFLGIQCSAPLPGTVSFMRDCARARRGNGVGAIVMLCLGQSFLSAPFWGFNAAHRCPVLFLLCGTTLARDAA